MNRKGIASTADAVVFLAMMMLAISAMYLAVGSTERPTDTQTWETSQARWTLQALLRCTYKDGIALSVHLVDENATIDSDWLDSTIVSLLPQGWGWNLTLLSDESSEFHGMDPVGNWGGWTLDLPFGEISLRVFRL